jgi:hypothetical protein
MFSFDRKKTPGEKSPGVFSWYKIFYCLDKFQLITKGAPKFLELLFGNDSK